VDDFSDQRETLNKFITECPAFRELQSHVGQFNIFRVLGIQDAEIRHSNMLAWLFTPGESHGLEDRFLKQYLMLVSLYSENNSTSLDPVEIDTAKIESCEVLRERFNIDLLIDIKTDHENWLFIIENKVNSKQGKGQLKSYRKALVEKPRAKKYENHRHFFIFLTKDGEEPNDNAFSMSTYEHVYKALKIAFEERKEAIGIEPATLIQNYQKLLEQKFMSSSQIQLLVQRIYKTHKSAIDTIIENLPAPRDKLSEFLQNRINEHSNYVLLPSSKSSVRFLPNEWNTAANRAGRAWGDGSAYLTFQLKLSESSTILKIVSGHAPTEWTTKLFARTDGVPFTRQNRSLKANPIWVTYDSQHIRQATLPSEEDTDEFEASCEMVWENLMSSLASDAYKEKVAIVKRELLDLSCEGTESENP
jgi:hypothetical protein